MDAFGRLTVVTITSLAVGTCSYEAGRASRLARENKAQWAKLAEQELQIDVLRRQVVDAAVGELSFEDQ